jgi:hypothetical protein
MTSDPNTVMLDGLALTWCAIRGDGQGFAAVLDQADTREVCRYLVGALAHELHRHHGDDVDNLLAEARAIVLAMELHEDPPNTDDA